MGTREITRGVGLSSTSVAYHHLQKLENLGLIEKNSYGNYSLKEKVPIDGHVWVGKNLVPRLMTYALFFMGAFVAEVIMMLLSLVIKSLVVDGRLLFATGMTFLAMLLFLKEGLGLYRKSNPNRIAKT
jgi:hypothetical protein